MKKYLYPVLTAITLVACNAGIQGLPGSSHDLQIAKPDHPANTNGNLNIISSDGHFISNNLVGDFSGGMLTISMLKDTTVEGVSQSNSGEIEISSDDIKNCINRKMSLGDVCKIHFKLKQSVIDHVAAGLGIFQDSYTSKLSFLINGNQQIVPITVMRVIPQLQVTVTGNVIKDFGNQNLIIKNNSNVPVSIQLYANKTTSIKFIGHTQCTNVLIDNECIIPMNFEPALNITEDQTKINDAKIIVSASGNAREEKTIPIYTKIDNSMRFYGTSDPQFGWDAISKSGTERSWNVSRAMADILSACTDCVKIATVAGDLTMENADHARDRMGKFRQILLDKKITAVEVLGNHDQLEQHKDNDLPNPLLEMLNNGSRLSNYADLYNNGWRIFDRLASHDCENYNKSTVYCNEKPLTYYTLELARPKVNKVAGYLIALHNNMYSASSWNYLRHVIERPGFNRSLPIVILTHQADRKQNQFVSSEMSSLLSKLNIAVIIGGHYHCNNMPGDGDPGHCDYLSTNAVQFPKEAININGKYIPFINTSASFHNIFWSFEIDPESRNVTLIRFNRGNISSPALLFSLRQSFINTYLNSQTATQQLTNLGKISYSY